MKLYKYTFRAIFNLDDRFNSTKLELLEYQVIKKTPHGYWIEYYNSAKKKKWVPKIGKNPFAFVNKKDALNNFIHRKSRQIGLIRFNLKRVKEAKVIAESLMKEFEICSDYIDRADINSSVPKLSKNSVL